MRVAGVLAYRLGTDHWERYIENIMLVSAEEVLSAAQRLLLLSPTVVIAGDEDSMLEPLKNFDRIEVYDKNGNLKYTLVKEK